MAFQTIRGENGVDFIGSDGIDVLFSLNETGAITADGKAGNDTITLTDSDQVIGTATIKGGAGNDTISLTAESGGNNSRIDSSSINGGAGNDTLNLVGTVSSVVRGNEDNDNFVLLSNYTSSTLNGNGGVDSFALTSAAAGSTNTITLSNSKILGGSGNDGSMAFNAVRTAIVAVDSTINGSKGNDGIQIGTVTSASNFTVFGGQGNDVITSANAGADGVVYSGDNGDDVITTAGAQDVINGGEGNDLINGGADTDTIDAGAGNDIVTDAAGADTVLLGDGNDSYADAGGSDTVTGGGGSDSYTFNSATAADRNQYVISSVSDSGAAITGATRTFDTLDGGDGTTFTDLTSSINIAAIAAAMTGDAITNAAVISIGTGSDGNAAGTFGSVISTDGANYIGAIDADNFDQLRTALAGGARLTASSTNNISLDLIEVDGDATGDPIDGFYLIINNTNTVLDSGDVMFRINGTSEANINTFLGQLDDYTAIGAGGVESGNAWILA